jgi:TRAP-type C4-dicarboxylate transport system permease small subunit
VVAGRNRLGTSADISNIGWTVGGAARRRLPTGGVSVKNAVLWLERHFEEAIAGMALVMMSSLIFCQVVARYVFEKSFSWTDEIAVYCLIWFVYISASWAVRERAHIRVMSLIELMPPAVAKWSIYLSDAIWIGFAIFLTWQGILLNESLWTRSYVSPALGIEQKWPYLIVSLGFAMMVLRLLQLYVRHIWYGDPLLEVPAAERSEPAP